MGQALSRSESREVAFRLIFALGNHGTQIDDEAWTLDRLRQTDLAVLRLAIAEMMLGSVPAPVIINEAVNLAKKYGEVQSGAFVNGLLAKLAE